MSLRRFDSRAASHSSGVERLENQDCESDLTKFAPTFFALQTRRRRLAQRDDRETIEDSLEVANDLEREREWSGEVELEERRWGSDLKAERARERGITHIE